MSSRSKPGNIADGVVGKVADEVGSNSGGSNKKLFKSRKVLGNSKAAKKI